MLTNEEFEKSKELFVKCEYCYYYNMRNTDPLVYKSVCSKCSLNGIEAKLKYAVKNSKFEPNDKWINAIRKLILQKQQKK